MLDDNVRQQHDRSAAADAPFAHYVNDLIDYKVAVVHPYLAEAASKNRLKYRESLALGYLIAAL